MRDLSRLPFVWETTTAPKLPFSLPIAVELNVTADSIQVHAERKGTTGELAGMGTDVHEYIQFQKDEIIGIEMFLMPDAPDDTDWGDLSWIFIRHRDPFGVEDYFESLFTSDKAYWPKALAKLLKERTSIEATITQETQKTRKKRLLRATQNE